MQSTRHRLWYVLMYTFVVSYTCVLYNFILNRYNNEDAKYDTKESIQKYTVI